MGMNKFVFFLGLIFTFVSCKKKDEGYKIPVFSNEVSNTYIKAKCNSCQLEKVVDSKLEKIYSPNGNSTTINIEKRNATKLNIIFKKPYNGDVFCIEEYVIDNIPVTITNGCGITTDKTLNF